ncbi:SAM and SH3 domain-containing protein 1 [Frankliniella fusca]|uniref:SAM and SH3 domain-containing protein 1 n=1 Tax=Frankliniella fusca TaxID=407009 RepID=A0AAE1H239_9NEOP|nr:SAM and SH3 domain-containing protein 1 [Frankliniella fusca]
MAIMKLNHGEPEIMSLAGETLVAMGIKPFNTHPQQDVIDAELSIEDGQRVLTFKSKELSDKKGSSDLTSPPKKNGNFMSTPVKEKVLDVNENLSETQVAKDLSSAFLSMSPFGKKGCNGEKFLHEDDLFCTPLDDNDLDYLQNDIGITDVVVHNIGKELIEVSPLFPLNIGNSSQQDK